MPVDVESMESFAARVERATGIPLAEIPVVVVEASDSRPFPGPIFASCNGEFVVATGYPDDDGLWPSIAFRRFVV